MLFKMLQLYTYYVLLLFLTFNNALGGRNMQTVTFFRDLVAMVALAFSGYVFLLVT